MRETIDQSSAESLKAVNKHILGTQTLGTSRTSQAPALEGDRSVLGVRCIWIECYVLA